MEDVRKQDPGFTNFVPQTAAQAVDRYVRCRRNGLKPMLVPECLIACAKGLTGAELDRFETWVINPNEDLSDVQLVPTDTTRLYNEEVYKENCRHRNIAPMGTPPLPADDEKGSGSDASENPGEAPPLQLTPEVAEEKRDL